MLTTFEELLEKGVLLQEDNCAIEDINTYKVSPSYYLLFVIDDTLERPSLISVQDNFWVVDCADGYERDYPKNHPVEVEVYFKPFKKWLE